MHISATLPPVGTRQLTAGALFLLGPGKSAVSAHVAARVISGIAKPVAVPEALALAIATSAVWSSYRKATLVIRKGASPLLGIVGFFDEIERARLDMLHWQLREMLPTLQYVSYAQAETDCDRLAEQLRQRFGEAVRHDFHYLAMPRGGHIVLGMLAYALDLPHAQLQAPEEPHSPVIVVDDCALSGARLKALLGRLSDRQVVFAPLYSPPELRTAIEEQEPRVLACVSARDVRDEAPARLSNEYPLWLERVRSRRGQEAYWFGQFNKVAFAWNEPDSGFWNPVTQQRERGWNLLPPELCLKNRLAAGRETARIVVQEEGPGPLVPAPSVLFANFDDTILIGEALSGSNYALRGVGADMWRAIVKAGDLDGAMVHLRERYDVDDRTLRHDLQTFTEELVAQGLLGDTRKTRSGSSA